jgi:hypothetical protein
LRRDDEQLKVILGDAEVLGDRLTVCVDDHAAVGVGLNELTSLDLRLIRLDARKDGSGRGEQTGDAAAEDGDSSECDDGHAGHQEAVLDEGRTATGAGGVGVELHVERKGEEEEPSVAVVGRSLT